MTTTGRLVRSIGIACVVCSVTAAIVLAMRDSDPGSLKDAPNPDAAALEPVSGVSPGVLRNGSNGLRAPGRRNFALPVEVNARLEAIERILTAPPEDDDWFRIRELCEADRASLCRGFMQLYQQTTSLVDREQLLRRLVWFLGPEAVGFLLAIVSSRESDRLWETAVELLYRTKDPRSVPAILDYVEESARAQQAGETNRLPFASKYLERIAELGSENHVSRLANWLRKPGYASIQKDIALTIGSIGGPQAAIRLTAAYSGMAGRPSLSGTSARKGWTPIDDIARAIGRLKAGPEARSAVREMLLALSPRQTAAAIGYMNSESRPTAVALLDPLIDESALPRNVRIQLVFSLASRGSPRAVAALTSDLLDGTAARTGLDARRCADLLATADPTDPESTKSLRRWLIESTDPRSRLAVAVHLARGGATAIGAGATRDAVREIAVLAVDRGEPPRTRPLGFLILTALLPDPDALRRVTAVLEAAASAGSAVRDDASAALDVLRRHGDPRAVRSELLGLLHNARDEGLQGGAAAALGRLLPEPVVQAELLRALEGASQGFADEILAAFRLSGIDTQLGSALLEASERMRDSAARLHVQQQVRMFAGE